MLEEMIAFRLRQVQLQPNLSHRHLHALTLQQEQQVSYPPFRSSHRSALLPLSSTKQSPSSAPLRQTSWASLTTK